MTFLTRRQALALGSPSLVVLPVLLACWPIDRIRQRIRDDGLTLRKALRI